VLLPWALLQLEQPQVSFPDHGFISSNYTYPGATVHPIILNHLFHSHIGFHGGVRISAGINTACFVLANAMMRTSQSCDTVSKSKVPVTRLFWNPAYDLMVIAWVVQCANDCFVNLMKYLGPFCQTLQCSSPGSSSSWVPSCKALTEQRPSIMWV